MTRPILFNNYKQTSLLRPFDSTFVIIGKLRKALSRPFCPILIPHSQKHLDTLHHNGLINGEYKTFPDHFTDHMPITFSAEPLDKNTLIVLHIVLSHKEGQIKSRFITVLNTMVISTPALGFLAILFFTLMQGRLPQRFGIISCALTL